MNDNLSHRKKLEMAQATASPWPTTSTLDQKVFPVDFKAIAITIYSWIIIISIIFYCFKTVKNNANNNPTI